MFAVLKKELKNYFCSPIGYVVIGIFLFVFSAFFYDTSINTRSVNLTHLFYYTGLWGLMFIVPLLTMWSFAGERKSGTEQLIMTSPVSMLGVIIGKFISAFLLILIPVIFTLMYFGILSYFQIPDIPTYLTSMLGFILLSMTYISFGLLASSLTESPIISGILTVAAVFSSTLLPAMVDSLQELSLMRFFLNFIYGSIDITATILFVTLTILCILITMIIMQRRKSVE